MRFAYDILVAASQARGKADPISSKLQVTHVRMLLITSPNLMGAAPHLEPNDRAGLDDGTFLDHRSLTHHRVGDRHTVVHLCPIQGEAASLLIQ